MQIHRAARRGDHEAIAAALRAGGDVHARDGYGRSLLWTALGGAARRGGDGTSLETVRLLLDAGADPNATDLEGEPPIHVAVRVPNVVFLEELLRRGAKVNTLSRRKYSALLIACFQPPSPAKIAIVNCLHRAGADLDARVERPDGHAEDFFPLWACLSAHDFTTLQHLAQLGANPAPFRWSRLQQVVAFGQPEDVRKLAFTAEEVKARAPNSEWSAWLLAIARGDVEVIAWLAEKGADLTQIERCGHTALHVAARFGNAEALAWLLKLGFRADGTDDFGSTALYDAVRWNQLSCARVLLEQGAKASFLNGTQGQPIHEANSRAMVQLLVEMGGVDPNAISGAGEWPLREAAGRNDVECLRWLLAHGAKVDHTSTGETALHEAVKFDALEAMSFLLEHGADPNAEDVDWWLPYRWAHSVDAIRLLWQARAQITREDLKRDFTDPELVQALDDFPPR